MLASDFVPLFRECLCGPHKSTMTNFSTQHLEATQITSCFSPDYFSVIIANSKADRTEFCLNWHLKLRFISSATPAQDVHDGASNARKSYAESSLLLFHLADAASFGRCSSPAEFNLATTQSVPFEVAIGKLVLRTEWRRSKCNFWNRVGRGWCRGSRRSSTTDPSRSSES